MSKIIWFESNDTGNFDPFFVIADKITDACVLYEFKGVDMDEEGAELSIGIEGYGSRWKAVNFDSHDAADNALDAIAEIILEDKDGEYCISKEDGTWRFMED